MRLGTLDQKFANHLKPDLFIYQESKMPWFVVPEGSKTFDKFYRPREEWGKEQWARFEKLREGIDEWKAKKGGWEVPKEKGLEEKMGELKVEEVDGKL